MFSFKRTCHTLFSLLSPHPCCSSRTPPKPFLRVLPSRRVCHRVHICAEAEGGEGRPGAKSCKGEGFSAHKSPFSCSRIKNSLDTLISIMKIFNLLKKVSFLLMSVTFLGCCYRKWSKFRSPANICILVPKVDIKLSERKQFILVKST